MNSQLPTVAGVTLAKPTDRLQSQTPAYDAMITRAEGRRLRDQFPFHAETIMMNDLISLHSLLSQVCGLGQGIGAQCGQCDTVVDDLDAHWMTCFGE